MTSDKGLIDSSLRGLPVTYKRSRICLAIEVSLWLLYSCMTGLFVAALIDDLVNITPNVRKVIWGFATIGVFWWSAKTLMKWVLEFRLDEDQIYLKKFIGCPIVLEREEIQKVCWSEKVLFFFGPGETLALDVRILSGKAGIVFFSILPHWVPLRSLPPEAQPFVEEADHLAAKSPPILEEPVEVFGMSRNAFSKVFYIIIVSALGIVVAFCLLRLLVFDFDTILLVVVIVTSPFLALFTWFSLPRLVAVSNEGILHRVAWRKRLFKWEKIEAILLRKQEMQIWVDGRYTRVYTPGLNPDKLALGEEVFWTQIIVRRIPYQVLRSVQK